MKAAAAPAPKAMKKAMKVKAMKTRDREIPASLLSQIETAPVLAGPAKGELVWWQCMKKRCLTERVKTPLREYYCRSCGGQNMELNHSRKPETILAAVSPEL
jgi:hypothetical protein